MLRRGIRRTTYRGRTPCLLYVCIGYKPREEPDAGKLQVRFCEGLASQGASLLDKFVILHKFMPQKTAPYPAGHDEPHKNRCILPVQIEWLFGKKHNLLQMKKPDYFSCNI